MRISDANKRYGEKINATQGKILKPLDLLRLRANPDSSLSSGKQRDEILTPVERIQLQHERNKVDSQKARMYSGQGSGGDTNKPRVDISKMTTVEIRKTLGTFITYLTNQCNKGSLMESDVNSVKNQHYEKILPFAGEKNMIAIYAHMEILANGTMAEKIYATRFFEKFGRTTEEPSWKEKNEFVDDIYNSFPKGDYKLEFSDRPPSS